MYKKKLNPPTIVIIIIITKKKIAKHTHAHTQTKKERPLRGCLTFALVHLDLSLMSRHRLSKARQFSTYPDISYRNRSNDLEVI